MAYLLLKSLHIVSVAIWVGGLAALLVLGLWLARRPLDALPSALLPAGRWFGERVLVPAGVLGLLTGMGLVRLSAGGLQLWGLVALVAVATLDAVLLQRTLRRLSDRLARPRHTGPQGRGLLLRANALMAVDLVLLLSAVAAMVFKPAF